MKKILLNADVGEGCGQDNLIIPLVDIANIACGGHAGDEQSMAMAVATAMQHGVAVSAHPSYQDREHFGRRSIFYSTQQLLDMLLTQLSALERIAHDAGAVLQYVKPHGALYHDAGNNPEIAKTVLLACRELEKKPDIIGASNSVLTDLATQQGYSIKAEAFIDRRYHQDGKLIPRNQPESVIEDIETACSQALDIVEKGRVITVGGQTISLQADTLCLHGDNPNALQLATRVSGLLSDYRPGEPQWN